VENLLVLLPYPTTHSRGGVGEQPSLTEPRSADTVTRTAYLLLEDWRSHRPLRARGADRYLTLILEYSADESYPATRL